MGKKDGLERKRGDRKEREKKKVGADRRKINGKGKGRERKYSRGKKREGGDDKICNNNVRISDGKK